MHNTEQTTKTSSCNQKGKPIKEEITEHKAPIAKQVRKKSPELNSMIKHSMVTIIHIAHKLVVMYCAIIFYFNKTKITNYYIFNQVFSNNYIIIFK